MMPVRGPGPRLLSRGVLGPVYGSPQVIQVQSSKQSCSLFLKKGLL